MNTDHTLPLDHISSLKMKLRSEREPGIEFGPWHLEQKTWNSPFWALACPKDIQMSNLNAVVAVYGTHVEAEEAIKELQHSGIDMHTLSIIGKDSHTDEHVVGYYNTGDRMKYWGKTGVFWGGFWGLLFGSAFFAIPGFGAVLVAGPLVAWIVGALEGAVVVGGLSAIGAGLYSMGIPKDSVVQYETALKMDKYLLLVHGTATEVEKAKSILANTRPVNMTTHSAEPVGAATT